MEIWKTIDRYAFPSLYGQKRTEEACVKYVLTLSYAIPLIRIVGSFEHQLPDFYKGRLAFGPPVDPIIRKFLPAAAFSVDTPDLLLEHGRVPLRVELHDDATGTRADSAPRARLGSAR